ncbi:MAG TPA: GNAT family N-acetyltransferase [Intrasporangium sp.]|uniref:GNAT family N-acetyltransferase n=1 Tax=Intrasporangium sp. TaxID=1925024 RepID=UPI002D7880F8|nr:GNAT family N-acetyltransferase [Intrasporangium sp.]HET7399309.1 GNAT family N-acetyltransferase [Intrasporangium sp.]
MAIGAVDRQAESVLRQRLPVRPLTVADTDAALALCARDRVANVFVAARILEGSLRSQPGALLGHYRDGALSGLAWMSANVVPVGLDDDAACAIAARISRARRSSASVFGPSDQVARLWERLAPTWGPVRAIRTRQPLLTTGTRPSTLGIPLDPGVRPARPDEVDLVLPAAAHMFTEEIGYPPYRGSDRGYRSGVAALIRAGHTLVRVEGGEVVFKADVGSIGLGAVQVQGVWLHPRLRGRGLAVPAMAATVEIILDTLAEEVSLYVNDYNLPARATYARCGFREVGSFTTVLL